MSQATVSRVLNGSVRVSPSLRERVMWALDQTGYRPNALAQAMKTGRTGTIGIVISRITNPFYPELLNAVGRELAATDHRMLLWETTTVGEDAAVQAIQQGLVDGVIFTTAVPRSQAVEEARRRRAPMVLVNRTLPGADFDQVSSDNAGGAATIGCYLRRAGHRRIGLIGGSPNASTAKERNEGFREGLRTSGGLDGLIDMPGDFRHDTAYHTTREMLRGDEPPTAIFGINDMTAFGALDAAASLGIRVPDDLWVVGFDDVDMASWERIDLTTVRQPIDEIAAMAVRRLLDRISGQAGAPEHYRFPTRVRVRGTTANTPVHPDDEVTSDGVRLDAD